MRFTIREYLARHSFVVAMIGASWAFTGLSDPADAGSVYIQQSQRVSAMTPYYGQLSSPTTNLTSAQALSSAAARAATPELAASRGVVGGNYALTTQIGGYNGVLQLQSGTNNLSNVGILGGMRNNAAVLQKGHNLRSNLVLVNTSGLSVGIIQPPGSAPVNMLIARLPDGRLLIKR